MKTVRSCCLLIFFSCLLSITSNAQIVVNAGNDRAICIGDTSTIGGSPTMTGGMMPFNYSWTPTAGLSSATDPNPKAFPTTTTTYCVTGSDANGRNSSDCITITVDPLPVITFNAIPNVCLNVDTFVLTQASPSGPGGVYSGPGIVNSPYFEPSLVGLGPTKIVYSYQSASCNISVRDSQIVMVDSFPDTKVSAIRDTVCIGDTSTIVASGADTYVWTPNTNIAYLNPTTVKLFPDTTTTYLVIGAYTNGCVDTSGTLVIVDSCISTGIIDAGLSSINIGPNPTRGKVYIRTDKSEVTVKVFSTFGKLVAEEKVGSDGILDLGKIPAGQYILQLSTSENDTYVRKIIKE